MFVFSMRLSKKKLIAFAALAVCAVTLVVCALAIPDDDKPSLKAPDDAARAAFLENLGWQVISVPAEVAEVKIPAEFGDIYEQYNALQKAQGFDLSLYKLCRVKRYTYEVTNYPGQTGVRANLLVYGGMIIGGDISTAALDGFMHELTRHPGPEGVSTGTYIDIESGD